MSNSLPKRVSTHVSTTLHVSALSAAYVTVIIVLWSFPNQVAESLASVSEFSVEHIRSSYGDLIYYWTIACGIYLGLLLAAHRWKSNSWPDPQLDRGFTDRNRRLIVLATVLVAPVIGILFVVRYLLEIEWIFAEDGPSEWFTAVVFFIAGAVFFLRARHVRRGKGYLAAAPLAGVAALSVWIALEEISYGQRVVGVATPDWLAAANDQGEITLHNLNNDLMLRSYRALGCAVFLAMLAVTWWWYDLQRVGGLLAEWRDLLPDPALLPLAACIALAAQFPAFNELVEIFATVFLLIYLIGVRERTLGARQAASASGSST